MELKISKIQWKKVLAFALTLCMTISMVQLPVNAEETTGTISTPKHFNVWGLQDYEETATFFDAAIDRDAIGVQTIEENKTYTVDSTTGYYDAKWFSFTPKEDGMYTFKANEEDKGSIAALMEKTSEGEYRYITCNDYYEEGDDSLDLFGIESVLQKNKTYYLCAGYTEYTNGNKETYSFNVAKKETKKLSSQPVQYIKDSGVNTYSFTAPKTGYYELKYTYKNTSGEYSWTDNNFDWNCGNKEAMCIYGSGSDGERLYYVHCEAGKTYYLHQNYFSVENELSDAEISIFAKEDVQKITSSNAGKVTSEKNQISGTTTSKLFEVKLDESGYYSLNLDWGNAETEKDSIDGSGAIYNADGELINSKYFDSDSTDKFYMQKGKVYYLRINNLVFIDKEYDTKEYTALVTFVKDSVEAQEITVSKPGEFKDSDGAKLFKFTPTNTAYYNIKFVPQKDIDPEFTSSDIDFIDSDGNKRSLFPVEDNNVYLKEGQNYYINVNACSVNDEENVLFKVQVSQVPIENVDYSKGGKLATSYHKNENKIFKFTAQYTGQHILKYSWNNEDAKLWYAEPMIEENGTTSKSYRTIKNERADSYQSVYLKKGNTYYFDLGDVAFKSRTTKEAIDVDMSFDIAYYNGKTDIDTIKNGTPVIPGEDSGNTDKPDSGNTAKPDGGNTDKPDSGNTDKPDSGNTDKPDSGNTAKPDNGNTNKPDSGNTAKPDNSNTNKPNNNTGKPNTGKPAKIKVSKIKISALSNKIAAGKKVKLTVAVAPANASNKAVKWTTSNKKVAVISKNGVVKVNKKAGGKSVVLTAIAADGGVRATYKITVMKGAVKKVTITGKKVVKAGKKLKLKAKVVAGKKANKKLVWFSSNTKFATVNQKGVVKTTKAGKGKKVKITASATDGSNKKKVFTIKIK